MLNGKYSYNLTDVTELVAKKGLKATLRNFVHSINYLLCKKLQFSGYIWQIFQNGTFFSHMVSRIDPLSSDLGFSICDRVNPGICFIPQRSCSQATLVSSRLIFLWTVPNLTQGNLAEIICNHRKEKMYKRVNCQSPKFFHRTQTDFHSMHNLT